MEKGKLDYFRGILEKLSIELQDALDIDREKTSTVSLDDSIGRLSRAGALQSQVIALALQSNLRERLKLVRQALDACSKGDYGICVACKQPIAEARLEVMPETPLCVNCSR